MGKSKLIHEKLLKKVIYIIKLNQPGWSTHLLIDEESLFISTEEMENPHRKPIFCPILAHQLNECVSAIPTIREWRKN